MDGAAGENFSFRLQRASFLSFWEHLRQEIQASTDAVRLWGLVSANMDLFKKRVRRPSVGPPPPYRGTPHILRIHGFADVDPYGLPYLRQTDRGTDSIYCEKCLCHGEIFPKFV